MLLYMAAFLAILYAGFEIYCVLTFPRLGKLLEKRAMFSLVFSMMLSYVVAILFPATGIVLMMAALGSTLMVQPFYAIRRQRSQITAWWQKTVVTPTVATTRMVKKIWNWIFHPIRSLKAVL